MSCWALTVYGRVESVNELRLRWALTELNLSMSCWALTVNELLGPTEELNLSMSCWALTVYGRVESVNELLGLDRLRKS